MQKHCLEQQEKAVAELAALFEKVKGDQERGAILVRCGRQWKKPNGSQDYVMVLHCAKQQLAAYEALQ